MPAGVVKGPREERWWNQAKKYCGGKYKADSKRYWTCVNGTFQKMKANAAGAEGFAKGK